MHKNLFNYFVVFFINTITLILKVHTKNVTLIVGIAQKFLVVLCDIGILAIAFSDTWVSFVFTRI